MRLRYKGYVGVASFALVSSLSIGMAHAQALLFNTAGNVVTSPTAASYALLNGDNLALYIDQYGDLGAPRIIGGSPAKPGGTLVGGKPDINSQGGVALTNGTYAALYSLNATTGQPVQQAVENKIEYITLGNAAALEGYGIHVGTGSTFVPYSSLTSNGITASSFLNGTQTEYQAVSNAAYNSGATHLGIQQTVTFNEVGYKNIAEFQVQFTNNGSAAITNLQYVRAVNPNQGVTAGDGVGTAQNFGAPPDLTQFAINSNAAGLNMALGVRGTDPLAGGSTIYAVNGSVPEATLLTNPSYLTTYNTVNYVQLAANGVGATYVDRNVTHLTYTSPNYQGYLAGNPADAFVNGANTATPTFTSFADTSLVLESGNLATTPLAPGASETYTFYYTFDLPNSTTSVPEPGTISLLLGSMASVSGLALRARRRKK